MGNDGAYYIMRERGGVGEGFILGVNSKDRGTLTVKFVCPYSDEVHARLASMIASKDQVKKDDAEAKVVLRAAETGEAKGQGSLPGDGD